MDYILNYDMLKRIVKVCGWDDFLMFLQDMCPAFEIYSVSMDWFDNKDYICKAKGVYGDVVIGWE
jgi:hypothetical protein